MLPSPHRSLFLDLHLFHCPCLVQAKVLSDKAEERQRLELLRQGCTFSPKLSKRSATLQRPGTATDRLYKPDWVRNRRRSSQKCADFVYYLGTFLLPSRFIPFPVQ